jgi:hypothetical protein
MQTPCTGGRYCFWRRISGPVGFFRMAIIPTPVKNIGISWDHKSLKKRLTINIATFDSSLSRAELPVTGWIKSELVDLSRHDCMTQWYNSLTYACPLCQYSKSFQPVQLNCESACCQLCGTQKSIFVELAYLDPLGIFGALKQNWIMMLTMIGFKKKKARWDWDYTQEARCGRLRPWRNQLT